MGAVKTKQINTNFNSRVFGCCKVTSFDSHTHPYISVIADVTCNKGSTIENTSYKMTPRGKDLSTEQKQTIVCMSKNGLSSRKISDLIGISPNTVQKVLKRNSDRGSVENKERSGKKRLVSDRGDRVLERLVKKNRRQTLSDLTSVFNDSVPEQVSSRTVRRRLKEQCYQRCSVSKKITISKNNPQS